MASADADTLERGDDRTAVRPGFVRLTASDRPGVAQPVPERDIPPRPWPRIFASAMLLMTVALGAWEWRMRALGLEAGDVDDGPSAWAEQRRRVDAGEAKVVFLGDSRMLFDSDLDRYEALTGVRPVQLAIAGSNARPFLVELAAHSHFDGLVIVGIAHTTFFGADAGLGRDALERYHFESPSVRASFQLYRVLSHAFAFLDDRYRLSRLVHFLDDDWRDGVRIGTAERLWKLGVTQDDRQTWLWPRIETDERVRDHQRAAWGFGPGRAARPIADAAIATAQRELHDAVATIRARGGEVVFLRPPSHPHFRVFEEAQMPRSQAWDALIAAGGVIGVHSDDDPVMRALVPPEYSHLSRACATVYTDAYVRALAARTQRVVLRADAPAPLGPADCGMPPADLAPRGSKGKA
ncbi:hypothetical protein [Dokdonella sp.]|uniref:hypothetical protein n=1 Tax=Dokdonella sp. TaxID=2291710 RepID=UPI002F3E72F9